MSAAKSGETKSAEKELLNKIVVHSHKDGFVVDTDLFAKYSDKIKKLTKEGKVPKVLDLSNYDVTAVATLVDYMATGGHTKARITTFILGDLMEIARVLEMKSLREKIEEFILISAAQNPQFLMHVLTMISKEMIMDTPLGAKVIDIAVLEFSRITKTPSFNDIPLDIILRIFDRCDLNVESEYEIAEAAISWLTAKPERVHISYLVLRCIRIVNLTTEQRSDLFALISTMPNYARTVSAFALYTFSNTNSHRICVLAEHGSFKRCGNKSGNTEFVISVPNRRIVSRRKIPVKSSYVTAKPKGALPSTSEDKGEALRDGEDLKRTVFSVSQERRTTRAERMARYKEEDKKHEDKRRRRHSSAPPASSAPSKEEEPEEPAKEEKKKEIPKPTTPTALEKSDKTTKSSKAKRSSRKQRKSAGSSPDQSTYFASSDSVGGGSSSASESSSTPAHTSTPSEDGKAAADKANED